MAKLRVAKLRLPGRAAGVFLAALGLATALSCEPAIDQEDVDQEEVGQGRTGQEEVEYIQSEATKARGLPFSDAVRVGNMLYLSGQIGVLPAEDPSAPGDMQLAPGGIQPETRQTMENIKEVLEANGSSLGQVVKCLVMMADIAEWPDMNEVYVTYFHGHYPARSAFAGSGLAMDARVEIECWATVGSG